MGRVALCAAVLAMLPAPAEAAFPGENGKIAFAGTVGGQGGIHTVNPDGSGVALLLARQSVPAWSPAGNQIAYDCGAMVCIADADGSNPQFWYDGGSVIGALDWAPDATRIAVVEASGDFAESGLSSPAVEPGAPPGVARSNVQLTALAWASDRTRIAFADGWIPAAGGIQTITADGVGTVTTVPNTESISVTSGFNSGVLDWSPDSQRLAFNAMQDGDSGIFTIKLDGSDLTRVTTAPAGFTDAAPAWSPDGSKLAFVRWPEGAPSQQPRELFTVGSSGGAPTKLAAAGTLVGPNQIDWQPIPVNAYPRPKGASPQRLSLVLAYARCDVPNRTHGAPLAFPSCIPPTQVSQQLTGGTPDANKNPAKSVSHVRVTPVRGIPSTPADEADVRLRGSISDVRLASDLSDYTGDLELSLNIQITDKDNTPHPGGPGPATVERFKHSQPIPCAATADDTVGSTCSLETTFEALVPGALKEFQRAIWELEQVQVNDGAGDPFLRQGIFIP